MPEEMERINLGERMNRIGDLWCGFMHAAPMWPIHGHYECSVCGRRIPVPWAEASKAV